MIISQAFGALLLPATVGCIFILGNKSSLMKAHTHTLPINIALAAILIFSVYNELYECYRDYKCSTSALIGIVCGNASDLF